MTWLTPNPKSRRASKCSTPPTHQTKRPPFNGLKLVLAKQDSYGKTLTTIRARLQGEDSTLKSMSDLLIRAKEISVQAANDTMSADNRQALGIELKGLRDQMLSLANGQDSNGNYFFVG